MLYGKTKLVWEDDFHPIPSHNTPESAKNTSEEPLMRYPEKFTNTSNFSVAKLGNGTLFGD